MAEPLTSFFPLATDFDDADETSTACQYCGISYLLLTKYERMTRHVKGLEVELAKLQEFRDKYPEFVDRLKIAEQEGGLANQRIAQLEQELEESKQDAKRRLDVTTQDGQQRRLTLQNLNRKLVDLKSEVVEQRQAVTSTKDFIQWSLTNAREQLIPRLTTYIRSTLRNYEQQRHADAQRMLAEAHARYQVREVELQTHVGQQKSCVEDMRAVVGQMERKLQKAEDTIEDLNRERTHMVQKFHAESEKIAKDLAFKDKEIRDLTQRVEDGRKGEGKALETARTGLARKDEQIAILERSVREMHSTLQSLRAERQMTIDAHQSRIKQLQDKFLEDIKIAGRIEADKREEEVRGAFATEKNEALGKLRAELQQEMRTMSEGFLHEAEALRVAKVHAESKAAREIRRVEEDWARKYAVLESQLNSLKASNTADFAHYQSQIRALEERLAVATARPPTARTADPKEIETLKNTVAKREAEIKFLKETVRLECEERMELVAKLALIDRQPKAIQPNAPDATTTEVVRARSSPAPRKHEMGKLDAAPQQEAQDPEAKSFLALMKAAAAKKGKVLAARSHADFKEKGGVKVSTGRRK
ncbi:hypothetical protein HDU85_007204 [Gaertneriomyces sp. JEL0708]|nr:hypothetical protein HDU85_007204 [Gaertneriomyces sp. JEL0708]